MRLASAAGCCLALAGCLSTESAPADTYVVRAGDTLYSIAWRNDIDYRDLARINGIGADYRITIGQSLRLRPPPAASAPRRAPAPTFMWPTDSSSAPHAVAGGGILLAGRLGQEVRAAAAGRVVYTGNGIRSYGNLIILTHGESFLSAYAHNREMLVREGDNVAAGQPIARMGEAGSGGAGLYFEIRQNGKPVDPLTYLPAAR